jgi:hypothetical protein
LRPITKFRLRVKTIIFEIPQLEVGTHTHGGGGGGVKAKMEDDGTIAPEGKIQVLGGT